MISCSNCSIFRIGTGAVFATSIFDQLNKISDPQFGWHKQYSLFAGTSSSNHIYFLFLKDTLLCQLSFLLPMHLSQSIRFSLRSFGQFCSAQTKFSNRTIS